MERFSEKSPARHEFREPSGPVQSFYIFGSPSAQAWKEAGGWSASQVYPAGTELLQQGLWAQAVYLIERGLVKLTCSGPDSHSLIIGLSSRGFLLGPNSVLLQRPLTNTAEALTSCHLSHMTADQFRYWVKTSPQFSWQLHQLQSSERHRLMVQRVTLRCLSARQRLEQFLWEFISTLEQPDWTKTIRLQVPMKREELAQLIAITRQHLGRLVRELERDGLLRRHKGWWCIDEPQRLWHLTEV